MTIAEEESEAPSSSEMTASLSGISGCFKSVLGLEMVIWTRVNTSPAAGTDDDDACLSVGRPHGPVSNTTLFWSYTFSFQGYEASARRFIKFGRPIRQQRGMHNTSSHKAPQGQPSLHFLPETQDSLRVARICEPSLSMSPLPRLIHHLLIRNQCSPGSGGCQ